MKPHKSIAQAIEALSQARKHFESAKAQGLILGNDNHIGDIGEYWVMKHLRRSNQFKEYAPSKTSPYDIELTDGSKVSVKTMTQWSADGHGTQVKPLCGRDWNILAAVYLDVRLKPRKIALVQLSELLKREPFVTNQLNRREKGTKAYPLFQWWNWLDEFIVHGRA